jgi:hypothetical protein
LLEVLAADVNKLKLKIRKLDLRSMRLSRTGDRNERE